MERFPGRADGTAFQLPFRSLSVFSDHWGVKNYAEERVYENAICSAVRACVWMFD
jgi:hypothetical protein